MVAALSAGCATSAQGTAPQPAESASVAPSPPPSPSPPGFPMGQAAQADNGQVQATVFEYRQPVPGDAPAGSAWGGADVSVCVQKTAIFDVSVSRGPWLLLLRDGHATSPTLSVDGRFPQPAYPTEHRRLHPGDCVRGWIVFAVPAGGRPAAVQYAPTGAQPVNWTIR
jgi:hypothetical protein